jgi:pseudouridine synthase
VAKLYRVKVKGAPSESQLDRLRRGVRIGEARTRPCNIRLIEKTPEGGNTWYEVTLNEGRNQQIRRMFDAIGHSVIKLRRIAIGHVTDKGLAVGECRELTPGEVKKFFQPAARDLKRARSRKRT